MKDDLLRLALASVAILPGAGSPALAHHVSVDQLQAQVDLRDAYRFADVFNDTQAANDAEELQAPGE